MRPGREPCQPADPGWFAAKTPLVESTLPAVHRAGPCATRSGCAPVAPPAFSRLLSASSRDASATSPPHLRRPAVTYSSAILSCLADLRGHSAAAQPLSSPERPALTARHGRPQLPIRPIELGRSHRRCPRPTDE